MTPLGYHRIYLVVSSFHDVNPYFRTILLSAHLLNPPITNQVCNLVPTGSADYLSDRLLYLASLHLQAIVQSLASFGETAVFS